MKSTFTFGVLRRLLIPAVLLTFLAAGGLVTATHDDALFELDGNAVDDTASGPPDDWGGLFPNGPAPTPPLLAKTFQSDATGDTTYFSGGGSKDDLDITSWSFNGSSVPAKDEITDAYAAAYTLPSDPDGPDPAGGRNNHAGDLIVYFGADRFANNGDAQIGFWLFRGPVGLVTSGPDAGHFSGAHTVGDLLVLSDFTQGGAISTVKIFEWVGSGGSDGTLDLVATGADCASAAPSDSVCAIVNSSNQTAPWPYAPKFGAAGTFPAGSFYEGGINLSRIIPGGEVGCFSSFLAETRSSQSVDATLKDFALGSFNTCGLTVTKTPDQTDACNDSGTQVTYTYVVTNTGGLPLDISAGDDHLGDLTADFAAANGSSATLAAGGAVTFTKSANISATTINVVTVTGTRGADSVAATASATVTGHACSVSLTKTPDKLDVCNGSDAPVTYTYVLTNTGDFFSASGGVSDDNGTDDPADDLNVGDWGPLAPGASQTLTITRPISTTTMNVATASGTSGGSSVGATASATVNGHACSISLTKVADRAQVCALTDARVTYTYVVTNTGDFFSASGTLVDDNGTPANPGDDVNVGGWGPLAPGGSQVLAHTATVNGSVTNTATASGTTGPSGSVGVSANASAAVAALACDIEVTKSVDPTRVCAGVNTQVTYTVTVTNAGQAALTNVDVVDDLLGPVALDLTLAPGASQTFHPTAVISQTTTNVVTATGDALGLSPADSDTATATVTAAECFAGKIAPTQTTCQDFVNGTAGDINELLYGVRRDQINNVAPGVFFYFTRVTAPSASFAIDVVQSHDAVGNHTLTPAYPPLFGVQQGNQINLFNSDCTNSGLGVISAAGGQAHAQVDGASPGQSFIVQVKYDPGTVIGVPVPDPTTTHYNFVTNVNGVLVDQDVNGLDLKRK